MAVAANVSDTQGMEEVIRKARQRFGTVNGVIHSAGLADYAGIIQVRSREMTEEVLASKVQGTFILDRSLEDTKLDFFILCSSVASMTPSFGEVGYIAANTFLDHFAFYKTASSGVFCTSINWWTWKEVGMAVDAAERMAKKRGASASQDMLKDGILSEQGVDIFNRVLENRFPQVITSVYDLNALIRQAKAAKQNAQPAENKPDKPKYERPQLSTAYAAPQDEIEKTLTEIWQNQLGIQKVGIHDNFFDLGADSLNIVQVRTQIKKLLDKDLPVVTMYTYPSVSALRDYLQEEKTAIGFSQEETERLKKKESKGKSKLKQRQKRVKQ